MAPPVPGLDAPAPATGVPEPGASAAARRRRTTAEPFSVFAMSKTRGELSVILSLLLAPWSLVACKAGVEGEGGVVSIVTRSPAEGGLWLPPTVWRSV